VDQWGVENPRSMKLWHDFDRGMNAVEDREILRFVPALKRRLEVRAQRTRRVTTIFHDQNTSTSIDTRCR